MDERATYTWLLSPLAPDEFERTYYQRRVCVVRRETPEYYRSLLSVEDLDRVLTTHSIRHPDLQIVQLDKEIPASQYANREGVVDPLRATKLFSDGATLIFDHLHTRVPALARLCTALGQALSSRMQANVYFTPPDSQGFRPHWDTHDVFVLQVSGSKQWRIYDTKIPLPLQGQKFDAEKDRPGDVSDEFELQAGDIVYIPRGAMHAARSTAEPSLHVTTGLMAYTWADLFVQGVAAAALGEQSLRESLPVGFARSDFPAAEKARLLGERLARVSAYLESEPPFVYFSSEVLSHNRPCLVNLLAQTARLGAITLASRVRRRPDAAYDLQHEDSRCVIRCFGNRIELPEFLSPALEFALGRPYFAVGELPDCVDEAGKLTLVRRLVKEGLFECLDLGT